VAGSAALNARVSALQGQLNSKDEELSRLQSEMRDKDSEISRAQSEDRSLQSQLDAEKAKAAAKPAPKYDSDLK
jgi:peptidoglycan hydrolase CwlO-like protein